MRTPAILLLCAFGVFAQDARELLNRGVADFKNARYAEAVANFQRAVDLDPNFTTARLYLATAWMQQYIPGAVSPENEYAWQRAEAEFRAVLGQDAANKVAIASIASLYLNTKKWDEARSWYTKLAEVDPRSPIPYYTLGFIAWSQWYPAYGKARAELGMRMETPGPLPDAGVRARLRAEWWPTLDEGMRNLTRALEINPEYDDAMAYMNLLIRERADLLDSQDEYQRAVAEADQWVQKALAAKKLHAERAAGAPMPAPPSPGRITVGGNRQSTLLISQVPPVYPPQAKEAKIQGLVQMQAVIDKQGHVSHLTVLSGHPLLVPAALEAVKQWIYQPTLLNGEPVEVMTQIDVNFTLSQ